METKRHVYYKEEDTWIGRLEEYPDYTIGHRGRLWKNWRRI
jgi:hypothetical protein